MDYEHLRIKDQSLFWKVKEEAVKRKKSMIEAVEDALKLWLKIKP